MPSCCNGAKSGRALPQAAMAGKYGRKACRLRMKVA
jgi:hypothetical protein